MKREPKWLRRWKRQEERAKSNWLPYTQRDTALAEIGFATYADYLASPLWESIRSRRLAMQSTCSCCPKPATVVHHDTYYRKLLLGDEESVKRDLFPLCHGCHYLVEFDGTRKRSWGEAIKQFRRMLFKFRNGMSKSEMIRAKRRQLSHSPAAPG